MELSEITKRVCIVLGERLYADNLPWVTRPYCRAKFMPPPKEISVVQVSIACKPWLQDALKCVNEKRNTHIDFF